MQQELHFLFFFFFLLPRLAQPTTSLRVDPCFAEAARGTRFDTRGGAAVGGRQCSKEEPCPLHSELSTRAAACSQSYEIRKRKMQFGLRHDSGLETNSVTAAGRDTCLAVKVLVAIYLDAIGYIGRNEFP